MPPAAPRRQRDFSRFAPESPIVIDNGSSTFRIGWAGEEVPRVEFRNVVQRPRHRSTGEVVTIIGDHEPALMKYFDCSRSSFRSAFDNDVVYQFEYMEYILDYAFERLGASTKVDHPILMTECACNPFFSRHKMAELLFETYGVSSVAFGIDAAFSYKYNQLNGICGEDGLTIYSGHSTSRVIPFLGGEPILEGCCRTNVGGSHVTDFLRQLLSLKYPYHMSNITCEKAEELKMEHCYVAPDYFAELEVFEKDQRAAEEKTRYWQLPWVPPVQEAAPTEEEVARKAALKEKQGQRLREMAAERRAAKIVNLESELDDLEVAMQQLNNAGEAEMSEILAELGYPSRQAVESVISEKKRKLKKARGEQTDAEEGVDTPLAEKYPLVSIPDEELTPEQIKEKRKQMMMKTTAEGRLRAKQRAMEEQTLREKEDEERRTNNPEQYLEDLRTRYKELMEKVEQRKKPKTNGNHQNGNNSMSSNVGRGERVNAAHKERMRLLASAAFDRGKGEDTFGLRDEDWQLYKQMSKDNDDDEGNDNDEAELARVASKLQELDPDFMSKSDMALPQGTPELFGAQPVTEEDYRIALGVERFRCPEILFQPGIIGVDQAGLDEMVAVSLRRLASADESAKERLCRNILLMGGSSVFPGMVPRLESGIRQFRPYLSELNVVAALEPVLGAWKGASAYAAAAGFATQTFSIGDYYEKGVDYLREHNIVYSII